MAVRTRHPVDIHIGRRIRERRLAAGLTQADLAARLRIAQQAVARYETAADRVSASRLYDLARALGVTDMNLFFPRNNHSRHR